MSSFKFKVVRAVSGRFGRPEAPQRSKSVVVPTSADKPKVDSTPGTVSLAANFNAATFRREVAMAVSRREVAMTVSEQHSSKVEPDDDDGSSE